MQNNLRPCPSKYNPQVESETKENHHCDWLACKDTILQKKKNTVFLLHKAKHLLDEFEEFFKQKLFSFALAQHKSSKTYGIGFLRLGEFNCILGYWEKDVCTTRTSRKAALQKMCRWT